MLTTPPKGEGPVLECHRHDYRREAGYAALIACMYVLAGLGYAADGARRWVVPGAILIVALWGLFTIRGTSFSVGAEWLQTPKEWVLLYELVEVSGSYRGIDFGFDLVDQDGRHVRLSVMDVQASQRTWDLICNGILHSVVANGANVDKTARKMLQLPAR